MSTGESDISTHEAPRISGSIPEYDLVTLTVAEVSAWDEQVSVYDSYTLFHRKPWLDYLAACYGVKIRHWAIQERGRTVGYLCGGELQRGPFRIFGSPLKGWVTNFMGPVVKRNFNERAFLLALDRLAIQERWAMVEMESPVFSNEGMEQSGYEAMSQVTYIIDLASNNLNEVKKRIHPKARKAIRLAQEYGLAVEDTDDVRICDEVFDGYVEILRRKNLFPTIGRDVPRLVFEYLKPQDLLFALRVRDSKGTVVATGLFPHDNHTVYFSFTGSRVDAWKLFPNDFLQWAVIELATARGIRVYNMCGYGSFKSKYGGQLTESRRWQKYYWKTSRWMRRCYEEYFKKRIYLQGCWHRLTRQ